jgi:hypothetical protein
VSRGHDDYQSEPVRGLPERLPRGEHILWQGTPLWWQLATDVFHIRLVAAYFAVLMVWRGSSHFFATAGNLPVTLLAVLSLLPIAAAGLALLALLAWLASRTTVYTITNRRVVLRIGIALTAAINIPFSVIGAAALRTRSGDRGDISLSLASDDRLAYSSLWPHVRPWRLNKPEPMLRGLADARQVASLLSRAVLDASPAAAVVPGEAISQAAASAGKPSYGARPTRPLATRLRLSS